MKEVLEENFRSWANTGDLMFFKGRSFGGKLQRMFTLSQFDHVAMVLRDKSDKILLFEATGNAGVTLMSWDTFLGQEYQRLYDNISVRFLEFTRTGHHLQTLERFIGVRKIVIVESERARILFECHEVVVE